MPTHGKRGTYTKGCRCEACVLANKVYMRRYRLNAAKGILPAGRLVSSQPVHAAIRSLMKEDFTRMDIAQRLGYKNGALQFYTKRMRRTTAVKVLRLARFLLDE